MRVGRERHDSCRSRCNYRLVQDNIDIQRWERPSSGDSGPSCWWMSSHLGGWVYSDWGCTSSGALGSMAGGIDGCSRESVSAGGLVVDGARKRGLTVATGTAARICRARLTWRAECDALANQRGGIELVLTKFFFAFFIMRKPPSVHSPEQWVPDRSAAGGVSWLGNEGSYTKWGYMTNTHLSIASYFNWPTNDDMDQR